MARTPRKSSLESRTARLKLRAGNRVWINVGNGISLCYRRSEKGVGTWTARLWLNKEYRFTSLGEADDYRDADGEVVLSYFNAFDKARRWAAQETKSPIQYKNFTVRQAAERYLEWFKDHRKSYRNTYIAVNAHIMPEFGDKLVSDLKTREIKEWHDRIAVTPSRKRGLRREEQQFYPSTPDQRRARKASANRMLTILKAILNKAYHDELVQDNNVWKRVKPFGNTDEPIIRFLNDEEYPRFINACPIDFRALVKAALFTGARYGELTRLKIEDVKLDISKIHIPTAKGGRGRYIPLSIEGKDFFEALVMGKAQDMHVLIRNDGKIWGKDYQHRSIREVCKNANIIPAITFHDLRHTYASLLAQRGADLLTISKLLGHSDTRITSRHYAHLCDRTLANAVETLLPDFGHRNENSNIVKLR